MTSFYELWFGQSVEERLLRLVLANQLKMMAALKLDAVREEKLMADFKALQDEVAATRGAAESVKVLVSGLDAKILELGAGMNDADDQAKVEAFAKEFAEIRATLPQAVVENPGGSVGGIKKDM